MNLDGHIRALCIAGGLLSLALGVIGAVLPIMPTVPFILLAAFCFARSSPRLEHWLETHNQFGPMIANWRRYGAISKRMKLISVGSMALSPLATWYLDVPLWALAAQIVVLAGAATYVLTRPSVEGGE